MGLGEGEDARLLEAGHAYGYDTDSALGGFADAEAWPILAGRWREALEESLPGVVEDLPYYFSRVSTRTSPPTLCSSGPAVMGRTPSGWGGVRPGRLPPSW